MSDTCCDVIYQLDGQLIKQLVDIYKKDTAWGKDYTLDDVQKMLQNCNYLALIDSENHEELIGFARYLTDSVYRAMIYDVVVSGKFQGRGFGRVLIHTLLEEKVLHNVERIELYTSDKNIPFYEKFGFSRVERNLMQKVKK